MDTQIALETQVINLLRFVRKVRDQSALTDAVVEEGKPTRAEHAFSRLGTEAARLLAAIPEPDGSEFKPNQSK